MVALLYSKMYAESPWKRIVQEVMLIIFEKYIENCLIALYQTKAYKNW